jgi:hypothetical protein
MIEGFALNRMKTQILIQEVNLTYEALVSRSWLHEDEFLLLEPACNLFHNLQYSQLYRFVGRRFAEFFLGSDIRETFI